MPTYHKYTVSEDGDLPEGLFEDMFDISDYVLLKLDDGKVVCVYLDEYDEENDEQVVGIIDVPMVPKGSRKVSKSFFNRLTNLAA